MNSKRVILGIGIVLIALAAFTAPAVADAVVYFEPDPIIVEVGETVTGQIMWHVDANESGARSFQIGVDFDTSIINITEGLNPWFMYPYMNYWDSFSWRWYDAEHMAPLGGFVWTIGTHPSCWDPTPITVPVVNFTIEGVSDGISPLIITREIRAEPTIADSMLTNCTDEIPRPTITWINGTVICGSPETFEKELSSNEISIGLPLTPLNNSTSAVLDSISGNYSTVKKYVPGTGFVNATTMDPGIGYNIHMTAADTWSYEGYAYESLNIELAEGLNYIGWTNTSAELPGALDSIAGKYRYVARWNASGNKFEVYDPVGETEGSEFIDFTPMERGVGYWIVAETGCTLTYP